MFLCAVTRHNVVNYEFLRIKFFSEAIITCKREHFRGITGIRNGQVTYSLPDSLVTIRSSGVVEYKHIVTLTSQCSANLANWPFDSHKCTLYIGSPIYYNELVNYSFPYERFYSVSTFF